MFSASAWTNNSELALVQLFLENKDMYDDPKRKVLFWRHISETMFEMKYVYRAETCSAKFSALYKDYKDLCEDAESTGAVGPLQLVSDERTRKVMEVMHAIKQYDVDVQPTIIMSAGVNSTHKVLIPLLHSGKSKHLRHQHLRTLTFSCNR